MTVVLTEQDVEGLYGSRMMSGAELGDRKIRATINNVRKETLPARGAEPARTKLVLTFDGLAKELVLNSTNNTILRDAISRNPGEWVGAEIGISAELTNFAGKPVRGLRVKVFKLPAGFGAARPAADAAEAAKDDSIPF